MGIAASIVLIAVGAVLVWAVDATVRGFELYTAGVILLVVGVGGLLLALVFAAQAPRRRSADADDSWAVDR
jgi:hypothetical protein